MNPKLLFLTIMVTSIIFIASSAYGDTLQGTANSRPNLSGGYDFYDSSGNKIGSSSKRRGGGFDYYNQYGNKTGSLRPDPKKGTYHYYDADNIKRGKFESDLYGGYRYYEKKEGLETPEQMQIRRHYEYQNPYGEGIETLPPAVIKGEE